jgi:hypothetical protein
MMKKGADDGLDALKAVHVGRDHPRVTFGLPVFLVQVDRFLMKFRHSFRFDILILEFDGRWDFYD